MHSAVSGAAIGGLLAFLVQPVLGQVPELPDAERYGRVGDENSLRICIDPRDPAWQVDRQIAEAIAGALLLTPSVTVIESTAEREELDAIYRQLLENCSVYFGFKLVAGSYPEWLTLTRPYYDVGYRFVTADPDWQRLGDIPRDQALGPTIGTSGDFALVQYLNSLPAAERWRRFPMTSDVLALEALSSGEVAAALVWAPSLYELGQADPEIAALRVIAADPAPQTVVLVGAVLLSRDGYLRTAMDEAIASLVADGTIAAILDQAGFPATPPR